MAFKRWVIDKSSDVIGRLRAKRRIAPPRLNGPVKVNLGSALGVARGWINIDGSLNALFSGWPEWFHKILYRLSGSNHYYTFDQYHEILAANCFLHHNLEMGVPLQDNTVDFIFNSHFLEHLAKPHAMHLLDEIYRVLKPGGLARINVPDLAFAVALYTKGEKERMLDNYFFVDMHESYFARHKYMYDFEMLKKILEEKGFREVVRRSYRQGEMPDIDVLDNRPEETLYVEARKR